jgi:hypothetical protein
MPQRHAAAPAVAVRRKWLDLLRAPAARRLRGALPASRRSLDRTTGAQFLHRDAQFLHRDAQLL